ncbi:MAG: IPTL-CTERM sorting domain-containing protein, partial [Desulfobacteraceae bacterium]
PIPVLTKEFLEVGTLAPDPVVTPGDDVVLRFTIANPSTTSAAADVTFIDELTDGGPGTGFLPFPLAVTLPPVPDPPCGIGSSLGFVFPDTDRQALRLTGGSMAVSGQPGDSCTFDVTLTVPTDMPPGVYTNTTEEITATVDGATRTGHPASDTLTVIAAPALNKTFTDDPVAPGDTVTLEFTLSLSPNSPTDATGIGFTDDLAALVPGLAGLTATLPPNPDPPCGTGSTLTGSAGDTFLTLAGGTLSPGGSCTFSVTLDVPPGTASGTYTNTTSGVSATVQALPVTSPATSADLEVGGMVVSKEFLGDPAFPGKALTLRFNLENISAVTATGIGFTDSLIPVAGLVATDPAMSDDCGGTLTVTTIPGLGSFLDYSGGSLAAGMSCTLDVEVTVPGTASDGVYQNMASNVSYFLGATPGSVGPMIDDLIVETDQVTLTKEFTDDPVAPGDPVAMEFTLTNLDTANAATGVAFTDDLGAALPGLTFDSVLFNDCGASVTGTGTTNINITNASLAAGGSCTLRTSLTVPGGASAGIYTNTTSTVSGTISGSPVTGDVASDDLEVIQLLPFSKSFDGPTTATGAATLTFTITNPGANTANGIAFSDNLDDVISGLIATSLPAQPCGAGSSITGISTLTFSGGSLPPFGGTCSFDVDVLVPATATPGTFPNTTSELFSAGLKVADPATADLTIEPAPLFGKAFSPGAIPYDGTSTLTFTIDNTASALGATALDFTDNLPAGMTVASPANASTSCTGGTLTAASGSGVISYSGGTIGTGASCTVQVDITSTTPGTHTNTSGDLTSSSGNSGTATDSLTVDSPPPGFSKQFSPSTMAYGGTSTLTFTIDNSASIVNATSLDFTDNLPAGVVVADPTNASTTCSGGTVTAAMGTGTISYTGGTGNTGTTCTVQADVTSITSGTHNNTSGDLTSSLGNSGTAFATLIVDPAVTPGFNKGFSPATIAFGGSSTLTFTIDNTGSLVDADSLDFTDNLPAGVVVADPANSSNTCTGGALTAVPGTGTITYTGGSVTTGSACTIAVDVTSSNEGSHLNTTGDLTSNLGNSGTASATLTVGTSTAPIFTKAFAPDTIAFATGISTLTFTIDNTASLVEAASLDFTDNLPAGIIIATPANSSHTCTGGTLTAAPGTGIISYTGGSVTSGATCTITVDINGSVQGAHLNTTENLVSSLGSSGTASATITIQAPFDDGDGVSFIEESGPDGTDWYYDGNGDSIPDNIQGSVCSLHTNNNAFYFSIVETNGFPLANVAAVPNPSPVNAPQGMLFPYGFFQFDITGLTPGQSTTLDLILPGTAAISTYWKYGPTPGNPVDDWYDFLFNGITGANVSSTLVSLTLVDGGRGDDDLSANGVITDQGGPAFDTDIPTLSEWGMIILGLILAGITLMEIRKKRIV